MALFTIVTLYLVGSLLLIGLFKAATHHRPPSLRYFEDEEQARFLSARAAGTRPPLLTSVTSITRTSTGTMH